MRRDTPLRPTKSRYASIVPFLRRPRVRVVSNVTHTRNSKTDSALAPGAMHWKRRETEKSIAEVLHSAAAMTIDASPDKPTTPTVTPRFARLPSRVTPVLNEQQLEHLQALASATRPRLLKAAADDFASSGESVFVHYAAPILQERRTALLKSGTTNINYFKTASQLWPNLPDEEQVFWNEVIARQLRLSLMQKSLSYDECVKYAGKIEDVPTCLFYAEAAVCRYLGIEEPDPPKPDLAATADPVTYAMAVVIDAVKPGAAREVLTNFGFPGVAPPPQAEQEWEEEDEDWDSLDPSQPRFECTRDMMYRPLTRFTLEDVRRAEGRLQFMMLRHLSGRFDNTGRELFLYYVVPRLCKQYTPPRHSNNVLGLAREIWADLIEREKETWWAANVMFRGELEKGDEHGLVFMELGSLDGKVISLHDMAETALKLHEKKKMKVA
ncbi:hypothetical protein EJ03DRAFT_219012 [Teratosphaeria nubilosa]|uniref:Uncharacterized protein n=1 Tax=Teratosphaeria nubilosa TaxID=161662 RepID=A0A6G1KYQ9_9PEZI|nr:hypothetical protein EJ03DRAFT_219012 [Teratosphaeria nubilosa]